jgi:hypothetical protein
MNKKNNVAHLLYFRIIAQKENYISFLMNEYKVTEEQAEKSLKKFLRTCKSKMFLYNNKYELQDDKEEYYLVDKKTKERYSLYLCPFKESLTTILDKKMEIDTPRLLLDLTEHGFSEKDIFSRKRELEKTDVNNTISFSKIKQEIF